MTAGSAKGNEEIFRLAGSPYEIGYKHGMLAKDLVHNSLETYERMFKEHSGFTWNEACDKAKLHLSAIESYSNEFIKEMEGVADGASVRFEDILALNARSEIALATSPDGCTSLALIPPKTNHVWLAQNWDWRGSQLHSLIHLEIRKYNAPIIQMVTEAGIIGKIGCNSSGIGVCLNALVTNTWEPKVPIHLGLRAILESSSFEEAVRAVSANQMASPANFLIASKEEEAACVEVSPMYTDKIFAKGGVTLHTNHLCSQEMKNVITEKAAPSSYSRLSQIEKRIHQLEGNGMDADSLFRILSDHENYPISICRHPGDTEDAALTGMETVFSIVMNLSEGELTWIRGKPCIRARIQKEQTGAVGK